MKQASGLALAAGWREGNLAKTNTNNQGRVPAKKKEKQL
jgi:hypothetical protein